MNKTEKLSQSFAGYIVSNATVSLMKWHNISPWCLLVVPAAGMQALFQVSSCGNRTDSEPPAEGRVRQYFIAAEKVLWNYAPSGMDIPQNILLTANGR